MLNRMTELATKSANGTYTDDVDRKALQDEVSALKDEINRMLMVLILMGLSCWMAQ